MGFKFNGEKLKTARTYRSMTLAELGRSIDLSKQTLSLYENNKGNPDFETIMKLSKVLNFPTNYFNQESSHNIKSGSTYFRSLSTTTKKSRLAEITRVEFIGALYEALYKYVDFPKLNLPKIYNDNEDLSDEYIEKLASDLRSYWGLGSEPIKNLQYVLESNGLIVTGVNVPDRKIDAYSQIVNIDDNETYIIVLCVGKKGKARINFDMAHELGHIILHPWTEDIETLSNDEFKERERQANKFASSFLLPRDTFLADCRKYPTELEYYRNLKNDWEVSIQAMIFRANDLDVISNNQYQYLMRQVSSRGWRKKEPGDYPYTLNENIFKMAIKLLLDNDYSKEDIVNMFNESSVNFFSDEIEGLLNLPEGYLKIENKCENNIVKLKLNEKS
ncbi:XRE family transcriptional regulator [uncultured Anaerococcus sp.]|uniref:helix-turn-helix domain-containing protein n=1 Tax=uncultured Anaerococcus sp. TaxID=293428 RepID=UPI00280AB215|nr:XRE family transcriptional regulator [uncultured Anaerococcus sp.]